MKQFFDNDVLLGNGTAKTLYDEVKALPIIDYHCHLDQRQIAADTPLTDIGELWLGGDHYKWRAMRLCGVDEHYITGGASWREKFFKYAEVMPKLVGNPLYYWSHLELKQVFGINEPLNAQTAADIYSRANAAMKGLSVRKLLARFGVEYIATTDDAHADLSLHGKYGGTTVSPTFRPDKVLKLDQTAIADLAKASGIAIKTLNDCKSALCNRLDYFVAKGCVISDHGFLDFPKTYLSDADAERIFFRADKATAAELDGVFGNLLLFLLREYKKRNMTVQLHFSVIRNINTPMFKKLGADNGFDVISHECDLDDVMKLLDSLSDEDRPTILLYSLNPSAVPALASISGAYRNVIMGAAWWFNDTAEGIRRNLSIISEYAVLGTNLGMLTDSRSFISYSRFDFFRRILCSFVGEKIENGEYNLADGKTVVRAICYDNAKNTLRI